MKNEYQDDMIIQEVEFIETESKNIEVFVPKKKNGFRKKLGASALILVMAAGVFASGFGISGKIANDQLQVSNQKYSALENKLDELEDQLQTIETANANSTTSQDNIVNVNTTAITNDNAVSQVFEKTKNSVVSITTTISGSDYFGRSLASTSMGSGIVYKEDSENVYIVTNYHVVDGGTKVEISLDDKNSAEAHFVGGDEKKDIAIIYVTKADLEKAGIKDYTIATFADSSKLLVGEAAIAIGNAAGEGKSATLGIISALEKTIEITESSSSLNVIQTDAAINPGNSGGALLNIQGEVVGINTAKYSSYGGVEGMGYAIPSNDIMTVIESITGTTASKDVPYVGVTMATITEEIKSQYKFDVSGVYINSVEAGSPANNSGLLAGDIVTKVNGVEVLTSEALAEIVSGSKVGADLEFEVYRNKATVQLEITVGNRKSLNF